MGKLHIIYTYIGTYIYSRNSAKDLVKKITISHLPHIALLFPIFFLKKGNNFIGINVGGKLVLEQNWKFEKYRF